MKRDILLALIAYCFIFLISFLLSINLGMGGAESAHYPYSGLFYIRRGLMVILAVGIPWFTRGQPLSALGWKISLKWFIISLLLGVAIGLGNRGGFNPAVPIALTLALFHSFATEIFFRGYLFRTFSQFFKGLWIPILFSSFLYGLSYLTVWTTWTLSFQGRILFVMLFTVLGVVFTYSYKKSGSFLVPWLMHFFGVLQYRILL